MLYDSLRIALMLFAAVGMVHMISTDSFMYISFPITMLVWGIYSFFDENDKEYIRRNGYDQMYFGGHTRNTTYYSDNSRYMPRTTYSGYRQSSYSNSKDYESIAKKCTRNFNVTIAKDNDI